MRKLLILILAVTFTACNAPAPAEQVGAGFFTYDEGEKYIVGSDDITDIWVKYIEAHNKRDMESIMAMDSDSIAIVGPDGARINGKEMHEQALTAWFEAEDPKWEIYWAMPYEGVNNGATWVVAGHSVTLNVEGQEVKVNSMIDGEIIDGKVSRFFVYNMAVPATESEE
tara:strand:+ start:22 stop:528 length:507 start_codon:yes stop_codon:yes gene_type:complete